MYVCSIYIYIYVSIYIIYIYIYIYIHNIHEARLTRRNQGLLLCLVSKGLSFGPKGLENGPIGPQGTDTLQ